MFIDFRTAENIADLALMLATPATILQSKLDSDNPTIDTTDEVMELLSTLNETSQEDLTNGIKSYTHIFKKYEIPKKNKHRSKERRTVWEITNYDFEDFYKLLAWKLKIFFEQIEIGYPHQASYGYTKGKNILENAFRHCRAKNILHADIKDFFSTITKDRIYDTFKHFGFSDCISNIFANLLTIEGVLAQGLPTSPLVSNIICIDIDNDLTDLASKYGCTYTRYADDITISGNNVPTQMELVEILQKHGFELNIEKFRITKPGWHHFVTGLSVETNIPRIPKKMRKRLRQELYYCDKYGVEDHIENSHSIVKRGNYIQQNINRIDGTVRYISYFDKLNDNSEFEDLWTAIKRGQNIDAHYVNQVKSYVNLFIDETEIEILGNKYLALGIVAAPVETTYNIKRKLYNLLNKYIKDPYCAINKENLIKRGLHCSDASEDLREDYIDLLNHQNLKFYIGYKKLDTPKSYEDAYISILQNLLQDRLLNTKYGVVQIFIEKNEKVPQKHINALFKLSHIIFADKTNILLSLADFALAYFRYYATSTACNRHVLFFEKLRGKYKVIKNIDNLNTFTRRRPFYPELF